jgi:flagellar motor switch protein FliN/FliY
MTIDSTLVEQAAAAAAAVLPAVDPLMAAGAQPGNPHVTSAFAGAAVANLTGGTTGVVGVLVGADLVAALESSPIGGLDLAAAVQPALDAAAAALGANASAARTVELDDVADVFGEDFLVVPLIGAGIVAAVLVGEGCPGASATTSSVVVEESVVSSPATVVDEGPVSTGSANVASTPAPLLTPLTAVPNTGTVPNRGIEMLHGVIMDVTVELGRTRMSVRDLLALSPGTVLELDRAAGSPADLLVNGRLIARGEVVVVDEDFGLRVTEIVDEAAAS